MTSSPTVMGVHLGPAGVRWEPCHYEMSVVVMTRKGSDIHISHAESRVDLVVNLLKQFYALHDRLCPDEVWTSDRATYEILNQTSLGLRSLDVANRRLPYGLHVMACIARLQREACRLCGEQSFAEYCGDCEPRWKPR